MRLTLRTLLAWLDDTLSPAEVREIGRQVSESPFAKDLVERIHRVTRQRRLTVPPRTGQDSVDVNVVASYLDNQLDPDQVAELEKRCLTSDVHLAEVASVHQILSLIGQKAKVPVEARRRMYQLIKGREAVKPRAPRASHQTEPEPVSEPVQPWVTPPPPARPWIERFGPVALVVGLILVMVAAAWQTLKEPSQSSPRVVPPLAADFRAAGVPAAVPAPAPRRPAGQADAVAKVAAGPTAPEAVTTKPAEARTEPKPAAATAAADAEKAKAVKGTSDIPAGAVGLAKKPTGVLLRFNPERRDWDRLTEAAGLREQDRLLSLAPFRTTVELGSADVDLVGETEVWARSTPPTQAARLTLAQGRVVLHGTNPSLPFELQLGGKTVTVYPPAGGIVGVERLNRRAPGEPQAGPSVLRFFAAEGPVRFTASGHEETLEGPGAVSVEPTGAFTDKVAKAAPAWVTDREPPPFDQKTGEQFLKFFRADRPIVSSLVEASEDEQKDVARLAISALRAVGDISYIVPLLNKRGDAAASTGRRAAIAVLRAFLAQDPAAARTLREQLQRDLGTDLGATAEKLLVGYTAKEANDPKTYEKLVKILETTDEAEVGLRELALDNLMQLTGRDDLEYDPENPKSDSKGMRAWKTLAANHDLKPAGARPAAK